MKKSFAQVLQKDLTEKSFKNKPLKRPKPPIKLDFFKQEIYEYFINFKDLSKIHSSRIFYAKLFKDPVKICFYWCEEDWQGSIFTVYEYNNKFISIRSCFGSCEVCDVLPNSQEKLDNIFYNLIISNSISDINIHGINLKYTHPDLIFNFNNWFDKINKQVEHEQFEKNEQVKILEKNEQEQVEQVKILENKTFVKQSWAEIVSKKK